MVSYIAKATPEIALFAALTLGHALGRLRFGTFSLGGVAGSLVVALVIGQLTGIVMPDAVKAVCFALFIYAVGFKSGPEFFGGLNRSSVRLALSAVVQCVAALVAVIVLARACGLGKGFAAGIGAGALTQTAMLGTASDAVSRLGLDEDRTASLNSQMAVGFAMTYVFGTVGVIVFLRSVAPRLLGVDLKRAARELELRLAGNGAIPQPGFITPFAPVTARSFEVSNAAGRKLGDLTSQFGRASIERIVRNKCIIKPNRDMSLQAGDIVGVAGQLESVLSAGQIVGREVANREALSYSAKSASVIITDQRIVGQTIEQVRSVLGEENLHAIYVSNLKRQGLALPLLPGTQVAWGDVAELIGRPEQVDRVARLLGSTEGSTDKSDLAYHALAIVAGTLLGLCSVTIGGIPITLGVGGGVLLAGLCFGWFHTRYPILGALPAPAQWILSEFGLSAFAAAVGLGAGPRAVSAIREHGVALLLVGALVTLVPLFVAIGFGRFVLKLDPVVLLGAICGGQTVAAGLNTLTEASESVTPVLGFTVTYAISNVLLAVWGPIIVAFA
jgi:aspartate-alanine antiporter